MSDRIQDFLEQMAAVDANICIVGIHPDDLGLLVQRLVGKYDIMDAGGRIGPPPAPADLYATLLKSGADVTASMSVGGCPVHVSGAIGRDGSAFVELSFRRHDGRFSAADVVQATSMVATALQGVRVGCALLTSGVFSPEDDPRDRDDVLLLT